MSNFLALIILFIACFFPVAYCFLGVGTFFFEKAKFTSLLGAEKFPFYYSSFRDFLFNFFRKDKKK